MQAAICDMVTVARYLNLTLVVPELDKTSFWADSSDFSDVFNVKHFISSLRDEVKIVRKLPEKFCRKILDKSGRKIHRQIFSLTPVSWSSEKYYLKQILSIVRRQKVIHFGKTDARLANNGLPTVLQKLRCRVNYEALKFTPEIEAIGEKLISILQRKGFFVVLHLRYEMDMLSFSGCTHGCSDEETEELTRMRFSGFRKTILLDRRELVKLLDLLNDGKHSWDQFSSAVQELHGPNGPASNEEHHSWTAKGGGLFLCQSSRMLCSSKESRR